MAEKLCKHGMIPETCAYCSTDYGTVGILSEDEPAEWLRDKLPIDTKNLPSFENADIGRLMLGVDYD